jgi:hypothetical protein
MLREIGLMVGRVGAHDVDHRGVGPARVVQIRDAIGEATARWGVEAGSSGAKFAEQGLRVFQVGGTEAFSEARVKRGQQVARFGEVAALS